MSHHDVQEGAHQLLGELERAIVGKRGLLELIITALLADGHVLLEDVPGVAKTAIARAVSEAAGLRFARVQFTPDLIPADITGSTVLTGNGTEAAFRPGPVFANLVLGDEINRAPPKTQSALLEAMEERQVTTDGASRPLPRPFIVIGTQNPIEQEGTYPLPEAQLDRFMFMVHVGYPSADEEREILRRTTGGVQSAVNRVVGGEELLDLQKAIREVQVADEVYDFALALARGTRVRSGEPLPFIKDFVTWGAGPRASQFLILGAKAHAAIAGRVHVSAEDVKAVAHPVLRHRIVTNFSAQAEGITSDIIIDRLLEEVRPDAAVGAGLPGVSAD